MQIEVTQAGFDTIIAALRYYAGMLGGGKMLDGTPLTLADVEEIAINDGNPEPTSESVFALGDRLLGIGLRGNYPDEGENVFESDLHNIDHAYDDIEEVLSDDGGGSFRVRGSSGEEFSVEWRDGIGWVKE